VSDPTLPVPSQSFLGPNSILVLTSRYIDFLVGQVSPIAFRNVGWKYYIVFCILSFTNAIAMWALIPETVGKDLEAIDELLRTEVSR
jgi:hypothetical protein